MINVSAEKNKLIKKGEENLLLKTRPDEYLKQNVEKQRFKKFGNQKFMLVKKRQYDEIVAERKAKF